jgi:hypothetical protein
MKSSRAQLATGRLKVKSMSSGQTGTKLSGCSDGFPHRSTLVRMPGKINQSIRIKEALACCAWMKIHIRTKGMSGGLVAERGMDGLRVAVSTPF